MKAAAEVSLGRSNSCDRSARRISGDCRRASGTGLARAASHALRLIAGERLRTSRLAGLLASSFFQPIDDALGGASDQFRTRALEAITTVRESFPALIAGPAGELGTARIGVRCG